MPVIACPGCRKKYNLPESAAGQVATCKCGKRFKVGWASSKTIPAPAAAVSQWSAETPAKAVATSKPVTAAKIAATARAAPAAAIGVDDDFWDEGLRTVTVAKEPEPNPTALPKPSSTPVDKAVKKKPPREKSVRWGFDWGKVAGGLIAFAFFGGLAILLVISTGRFSRSIVYLAVPAIGGLFTAINGLMGEEGIW